MNIDTPSDYLVDAQRRAATTSEAEHRAKSAAAFDADLERLAELGKAAFFGIAKMRTDSTQRLLWEARSEVQLLNQRELLSKAGFDELLLAACLRLTRGDVLKAQLLASWAKEV